VPGNQAPGRIAEVAIFNTASAMSTAEKEQVESYLGVKYGITLSHNYVTSTGALIWNSTTNASFHNDVAGIARDDAAGLDQRQSTSINAGAIVTMTHVGAFPSNNGYLIWGNNSGAMSNTGSTDLPAGVIGRLTRVWKAGAVGAVGGVTIQFNLSTVPGSKTAADLRLLVDRNLDGLFAGETVGGGGVISGATDLGGGLFAFSGVTLNNNEIFTIGTVSATTPLPVIIASFNARLVDAGVKLEWETFTEINNDHFTIEKSSDGAEFLAIGTVPGSGNTTTPRSYNFLDPAPLPGRSYYRLSQTDFDGRTTLSKVVMIQHDPVSIIYPNPATNEVHLDVDSKQPFAAEITNSLGQKVSVKQTITNGRVSWNVENLPRGIYFITILTEGSLSTQKLILAD
jgi:hypothetical protein